MATPDILTAKINHGFDYLDADGDGQLTEHDHVLMGQRVAASLGHAPGSPSEQQIIETYPRIWRDLHLPHIPGGGTAISKKQFLKSTLTLATDPAAAQVTLGALATAFLAIADTDHDGSGQPNGVPGIPGRALPQPNRDRRHRGLRPSGHRRRRPPLSTGVHPSHHRVLVQPRPERPR